MINTVMIKGSKSGIILVLDSDTEWETLKKNITEKFQESSDFLGKAQKAISFQGRKLSDQEQMEVIDLIQANCQLDIICVLDEDEKTEKAFADAIEKQNSEQDNNTGFFFKGNLRSGQVLDVESSIIILGDVNNGAKVVSKGNVIILGSLKGNVYAGSAGNVDAFVIALDMVPVQIRIADTIARSPDSPQKNQQRETKIAFWEDGNIYIEPLDKDVINDIRLS